MKTDKTSLKDQNYLPPLQQAIPLGIQHVLEMVKFSWTLF